MEKSLTTKEAFDAMGVFLERFNERGGGKDDLVYVLGAISTKAWADGGPFDPAQWNDWLCAVDEVIAARKKSET
jgi:hypothetical protein